jgi:hypothetical protein
MIIPGFVACARAIMRATARPVCQALKQALARHGIPAQILMDNGKVFTARSGRGPGPVMSDRICAANGIKQLAGRNRAAVQDSPAPAGRPAGAPRPAGVSRWVNAHGKISLGGFTYAAGASYAGEPVEVVVAGGLVGILHVGVVIATHAQQFLADQADRAPRARITRRARDATAGLTVTRLANGTGVVSFAGTDYQAGRSWAQQSIDVTIVAGSVQLPEDGKIIRVHPIRHDRSRELGAFANPKGRPRRKNSAIGTVT